MVRDFVDDIGKKQFYQEGRNDVEEEHQRFGKGRPDKVERGGEDDDIEDIVDEA